MGKPTPCGQCHEEISESNIEAWEVYQYSCIDAMGVTLSGIETACRILRVQDPDECVLKVRELIFEMRRLEEETRKQQDSQRQVSKGR